MKQRQKDSDKRKQQQFGGIFLINTDSGDAEMDFDSIEGQQYHNGEQQQQFLIIDNKSSIKKQPQYNQKLKKHSQPQPQSKSKQQQGFFNVSADPTSNQSQLLREFEQIRFVSNECNLMDMDIHEQEEKVRSVLELSPYQYERFIKERVIQMEMPQLITEGYIMSYKLYQIKTRVSEQSERLVKEQKFYVNIGVVSGQQIKTTQKSSQQKLHIQSQSTQSNQYDTCVSRRFSDFQYLNQLLVSNYGGYIIPLLPQKNFWAIINLQGREYTQTRTKSLVKYLNRLFTHKKLKNSLQLKSFLFQEDNKFSTQKGEYLQKNSHLEDKLISLSTGAFEYGKALYNKYVGGGGEKGKEEEEIRLRKSKLNKDDLILSEYEIVVAELMRIMADMKALVGVTIEEMRTVDDISCLFSSSLTDAFNVPTTVQAGTSLVTSPVQRSPPLISLITTTDLQQEFEQISQFISSCYAAIQRRKSLKLEIQTFKQQQETLIEKYKNSPRSLELDIVRSKLNRLNKMNQTYAEELIKELESHVDEGKGMLKLFVVKFQKLKKDFFAVQKAGSL